MYDQIMGLTPEDLEPETQFREPGDLDNEERDSRHVGRRNRGSSDDGRGKVDLTQGPLDYGIEDDHFDLSRDLDQDVRQRRKSQLRKGASNDSFQDRGPARNSRSAPLPMEVINWDEASDNLPAKLARAARE